jgi:hypothetical protein
MTITSDHVVIESTDVDTRPGSSDVTWAERAYHHEVRETENTASRKRRGLPRPLQRHLSRRLLATLTVVLVVIGLVVAMRLSGSSPSPVAHKPTTSQIATVRSEATAWSPFALTPRPELGPLPSLVPVVDTTTGTTRN